MGGGGLLGAPICDPSPADVVRGRRLGTSGASDCTGGAGAGPRRSRGGGVGSPSGFVDA